MSKFTKGPWIVGGKYTVRTTKSSSDWICRMRDEHYKHSDEEDEANAHLIAAAPDMYEALKMVLEEKAPSYHDCTDDGLQKCAWCYAIEALAKAEGGIE